jgi:hypothetical protein
MRPPWLNALLGKRKKKASKNATDTNRLLAGRFESNDTSIFRIFLEDEEIRVVAESA